MINGKRDEKKISHRSFASSHGEAGFGGPNQL